MKLLKATIRETGDHWELEWAYNVTGPLGDRVTESHKVVPYPTAVQAQQAVRKIGKEMADAGVSNAIEITWEPATRIGTVVVRALT